MNLQYGSSKNLTATGTVSPVACALNGFYVNSTASGTLVLSDPSGNLTGTITPAIGWHWLPICSNGALTATIANTLNVTFSFCPTPAAS